MSIRKTIIAAVAGLALVAAIAPVSASAVTIEELQAQINALLAQLSALQGTTTTTTTGSSYSACAGVVFSGYLRVGSVGQDVKCLQQIMNGQGYTVATSGAGSAGNETTYFGSLTLAAVQKWQAAQGWIIATQVGPKSIALLNSIVAGSGSTTMVNTSSVADVYGTLLFGMNAFGIVPLRGAALTSHLKARGTGGTSDPLDQVGTTGWKAKTTTKILNDNFMIRLEHCCTV